jgi:hypothetical protein
MIADVLDEDGKHLANRGPTHRNGERDGGHERLPADGQMTARWRT